MQDQELELPSVEAINKKLRKLTAKLKWKEDLTVRHLALKTMLKPRWKEMTTLGL